MASDSGPHVHGCRLWQQWTSLDPKHTENSVALAKYRLTENVIQNLRLVHVSSDVLPFEQSVLQGCMTLIFIATSGWILVNLWYSCHTIRGCLIFIVSNFLPSVLLRSWLCKFLWGQ